MNILSNLYIYVIKHDFFILQMMQQNGFISGHTLEISVPSFGPRFLVCFQSSTLNLSAATHKDLDF